MIAQKPATIFALSSGQGRAGVAVIRISGAMAREVVTRMCPPLPRPRIAAFRTVRDPQTGEALDRAVSIFFPGPGSETGEDVAELQVHGGRAVVAAVLAALSRIEGCRLAEPGEFARRAFEAGKIDLAEAEGLADLVEAETEAQRRQALAAATGTASRRYEEWRCRLIEAAAVVEAAIDFSDEADVAQASLVSAVAIAAPLEQAIRAHLDDGHRGEILRDGFRVALLGPPNAGKSSLLNALARREAAIVSEEAGTTRDVIEVRLDLAGLPVVISDTAGVREAESAVEREGIRRSLETAGRADLVIWLTEAADQKPEPPASLAPPATPVLAVINKIDLVAEGDLALIPETAVRISARQGTGLEILTAAITARAQKRLGDGTDPVIAPAIAHVRHRRLLEDCVSALADFRLGSVADIELRAEDLRRASYALGRITGRVDVEDVLEHIFSRFCIGK